MGGDERNRRHRIGFAVAFVLGLAALIGSFLLAGHRLSATKVRVSIITMDIKYVARRW